MIIMARSISRKTGAHATKRLTPHADDIFPAEGEHRDAAPSALTVRGTACASDSGEFACTDSTDGEGLDRCSPVASSSLPSGAGAPGARCAELRRACAARGARSEAVSGRYETRTWVVRGP